MVLGIYTLGRDHILTSPNIYTVPAPRRRSLRSCSMRYDVTTSVYGQEWRPQDAWVTTSDVQHIDVGHRCSWHRSSNDLAGEAGHRRRGGRTFRRRMRACSAVIVRAGHRSAALAVRLGEGGNEITTPLSSLPWTPAGRDTGRGHCICFHDVNTDVIGRLIHCVDGCPWLYARFPLLNFVRTGRGRSG